MPNSADFKPEHLVMMNHLYGGKNGHKLFNALVNSDVSKMSASRATMLAGQTPQIKLIINPEINAISTGSEYSFGSITSSRLVNDSHPRSIEAIFDKHQLLNPRENYDVLTKSPAGIYDIKHIVHHVHTTKSHGYVRRRCPIDSKVPGMFITPNEVIYTSNNHDKSGNFNTGLNTKIAYMSLIGNEEDGIIISKSYSRRAAFKSVEEIEFIMNLNQIPLNIYGDIDVHKFIPDIGEYTKDGILCQIRTINYSNGLSDLSVENLMKPNCSDTIITGDGQVVDIEVLCNNVDELRNGDECRRQLLVYHTLMDENYKQIRKTLGPIVNKANGKFTYEVGQLYRESQRFADKNILFAGRSGAFEFVKVKVKIAKTVFIDKGFKFTNLFGGKGVVTTILPDHLMPVDVYGNRAEMILSPSGIVGRSNFGQVYHQELNFIANMVQIKLKQLLLVENDFDGAFKYLKDFLYLVDEDYAEFAFGQLAGLGKKQKQEFLLSCINDRIYMVQRNMDSIEWDHLRELYFDFIDAKPQPVKMGVLRTDGSVRTVTTNRPVIIGDVYMVLLEHLPGDKFSACSIGSASNLGIPGNKSKHKGPYSKSQIKFGEMEADIAKLKVSELKVNRFMSVMSGNPLYVEMLISRLLFNSNPLEPFDLDIDDLDITNDTPSLITTARLFCCAVELADNDSDVLEHSDLQKKDIIQIMTPLATPEQREYIGRKKTT